MVDTSTTSGSAFHMEGMSQHFIDKEESSTKIGAAR